MNELNDSPPTMDANDVDPEPAEILTYERPLPNGRRTWCPQWWKHDEAVYRLQALWLSWEYMRVNDGANRPATWLVNYADPSMAVLFDVEGPFKGCSVEHRHREARPWTEARLPCETPQALLFAR